jgi:hypothetical protein
MIFTLANGAAKTGAALFPAVELNIVWIHVVRHVQISHDQKQTAIA